MNNYEAIRVNFTGDIAAADTADALYNVKVHYWGKKGIVSELSKQLGSLVSLADPHCSLVLLEFSKRRHRDP